MRQPVSDVASLQLKISRNKLLPAYVIVIALLILLFVIGGLVSDRFLTSRNATNLMQQLVVLGFVSLGQTLVILMGGIDLAIGALVGACTVFLASFLEWQPGLVWLAIPLVLMGAMAVGTVNGLLIVFLRVHPLIVTLGMASIIYGCALMYRKEPGGSVPPGFGDLSYNAIYGIPISTIILVLVFVLAGLWLKRTATGRMLYFVGGDSKSARLNGLPVSRVTILAYALCGLCAGIAAIFLTARTGVGDPRIGANLTLQSITPVVVGGTILAGGRGGVLGTFLGVLLVTVLNNLLNFSGVTSFYQWVIQGIIIIVAVGAHRKKRG
jgi:ribose transport system permease protein